MSVRPNPQRNSFAGFADLFCRFVGFLNLAKTDVLRVSGGCGEWRGWGVLGASARFAHSAVVAGWIGEVVDNHGTGWVVL